MFWLSYEYFSILCNAFLLKSVISTHITAVNNSFRSKNNDFISMVAHCFQLQLAIPEKIQTGGLRIYFFEPVPPCPSPGIFPFFTLPIEIPDKTNLNPWIFYKIVLDPLEIPSKAKNKDPEKFHIFIIFSWSPLEILFWLFQT